MATMRCPHCNTEIKKTGSILPIVVGLFAFLFIGGAMFIIVCLAAITAIGRNADEKFDRVSAAIEAEATSDVDFGDQFLPKEPAERESADDV